MVDELEYQIMGFSFHLSSLYLTPYSRVHISSDTAFLKIVKKPSIVQE